MLFCCDGFVLARHKLARALNFHLLRMLADTKDVCCKCVGLDPIARCPIKGCVCTSRNCLHHPVIGGCSRPPCPVHQLFSPRGRCFQWDRSTVRVSRGLLPESRDHQQSKPWWITRWVWSACGWPLFRRSLPVCKIGGRRTTFLKSLTQLHPLLKFKVPKFVFCHIYFFLCHWVQTGFWFRQTSLN